MNLRGFAAATMVLAVVSAAPVVAAIARHAVVPVDGYRVLHRYPHDPSAFTEGLFYRDGMLYESTGQYGASTLRRVDLDSGRVLQRLHLPQDWFGEGIVADGTRLVQLSWRRGEGIVYDLASLQPLARFSYPGEGWALTGDGTHLYMSDGSSTLRVLDPATLRQVGRLPVRAGGVPVPNLNELEWVRGEIYANVWQSDRIARIDPASGRVLGWIDLSGLLDIRALPDPQDDVLNGIAYDPAHDRLFVTGKCWPWVFEIRRVSARGAKPRTPASASARWRRPLRSMHGAHASSRTRREKR